MAQEIETMNDHLIGIRGDVITVMLPPTVMTFDEALRFAAWLVVMADQTADHARFAVVLDAVERT